MRAFLVATAFFTAAAAMAAGVAVQGGGLAVLVSLFGPIGLSTSANK